jgi:PAS domain S-box-containing protein
VGVEQRIGSRKERTNGPAGPPTPEAERFAHLAAVVDASSDAILSKTLEGIITSWNASAERIFGYTAGEIVGQSIRKLIPEELQDEEDVILANLRAGRYIEHYETVRLTKDGRRLDVSLSISPVKNAEGQIVGASKIVRDITARKLADEQLRAATAKFESVFNQSGIFAGILDLDGNVLEVNALAVDGCGYRRDDVLGRPFWETPWWRGSPEIQARIRLATQQAARGEAFRETLPYWLADGTERIVEFAMHPIRDELDVVRFLHPTGLDVTERIRAEEALRAREAEEREIAIGLQRALLPEGLVSHPELSFAARYEAGSAALEVGGDWYDAFMLPDGRVAVTVGDVVGHGLAAAAAMGQLRTAHAALAQHASGPGQLLTRLDDFVERTRTTDFATVCYGVLDPDTGVLEYASAGHPPMLLVSPSGATRWLDGAQSPPLYGRDGRERAQASVEVEHGSLLLLYSDGLVERRGEHINEGLKRLERAAASLAGAPIDDVCERLVVALGVEASREDDVALLAVRYAPATTFRRVFPARPEELRKLRSAMREWLARRGLDASDGNALLLAVGEACANAIEHAYLVGATGDVSVEIAEGDGRSLLVEISDTGSFRAASWGSEDRGRGTDIMRGLTTGFSRDTTPAGTTVRFRLPVKSGLA